MIHGSSVTLLMPVATDAPPSPRSAPHRAWRKPQDFDGFISLEACVTQFEVLATVEVM